MSRLGARKSSFLTSRPLSLHSIPSDHNSLHEAHPALVCIAFPTITHVPLKPIRIAQSTALLYRCSLRCSPISYQYSILNLEEVPLTAISMPVAFPVALPVRLSASSFFALGVPSTLEDHRLGPRPCLLPGVSSPGGFRVPLLTSCGPVKVSCSGSLAKVTPLEMAPSLRLCRLADVY